MPRGLAVRIWYGAYNVVLHLGALLCLPYWLLVRLLRGRYRGQFRERMGILAPETLRPFGERPAVWVHAASAGETASAASLVRRLREAFPKSPLLMTVTSRYGKEMAGRLLGETADAICFSPLDLPLFVRRFLDRVKPRLYVMVETDLWPNMVRLAKRRGVPVVVASGHAGPRTFPRAFWRVVLAHVDRFWMQTAYDAQNIRARGAPADRVEALGNLKFDSTTGYLPPEERPALRAEFRIPEGAPVLVAGSTLAEDEGPLLDAIAALRREGADLRAIIAPRRRERDEEVLRAARERGLEAVRRTAEGSAPVLVLDTMGELARVYNLADVAYVGGGWTRETGLHNILEPAVCGAPVLFGPHHGKQSRIAAEFRRRGAGVEVRPEELLTEVRRVLTDREARDTLRAAGRALLAGHRGAAERVAARIRELQA